MRIEARPIGHHLGAPSPCKGEVGAKRRVGVAIGMLRLRRGTPIPSSALQGEAKGGTHDGDGDVRRLASIASSGGGARIDALALEPTVMPSPVADAGRDLLVVWYVACRPDERRRRPSRSSARATSASPTRLARLLVARARRAAGAASDRRRSSGTRSSLVAAVETALAALSIAG